MALNVTVTEPTGGELSSPMWPTGEERPLASSVNMAPGQTVPNMVIAQVGAGGQVSIYNDSGSTHVVVDVLGCFGSGVPRAASCRCRRPRARHPRRHRRAAARRSAPDAVHAARSPDAAACRRPGRRAVLLNVTAVTPDRTAPTSPCTRRGVERPLASNLNVDAGQVVPNMVIARLGADGAVAALQQQRRRSTWSPT